MLNSRRWIILAVPLAAIALLALVYFLVNKPIQNPQEEETAEYQRPADRPAGFRERSSEAGLDFYMNLLPNEQGGNYNINPYDHGSGVAVGDYNGDGLDDIYFVNQLGENALYRNNGDGTFTDVTMEAGVGVGDRVCVAATFADYDNSGHQSLFLTSTRGGNVLFKNLGNGKFQDVTEAAGLTLVGHCQTSVFFDYDNDGYLDLFVTGTANWTKDLYDKQNHYYQGLPSFIDLARCKKESNVLYHNEPVDPLDPSKGRKFVDVTEKAGLKGKGWAADVAIFDYDEDDYPDVFVTNMFGAAQLYHNNRNGTFTEVTKNALARTSWGGMGCKAFDFNNDGKLDLFMVDMHSDMWLPSRDDPQLLQFAKKNQRVKYPDSSGGAREFPQLVSNVDEQEKAVADLLQIKYEDVVFGNAFFKNLGKGKFEEISDRAGLETFWPWGITTGDFDNDGFEDVFIPSGMGYPFFYWPNALMMNNGNETFSDHSRAEDIEPPARGIYQKHPLGGKPAARSSRAAATADFRGVGKLDIVVNNFNDQAYYFQNQFPQRNYVEFRLTGVKCNRDAIGAVVRLYSGKEILTRQVNPAGGYLSQSSKVVHFGLGDRTSIDRVEIRWPGGHRQTIEKPALNKRHEVVESAN
ncbi:MAG: CRTAC1 family protein [Gemmataceae bacterium]